MTPVPGNPPSPGSGAWFCGDGAVCGVGSLPFLSTDAAIDFVARRCPRVPFWPQLRRMSAREAMIPQTLGPLLRHLVAVRGEYAYAVSRERVDRFAASLERADARFDPGHAAGFYAFVDACERGRFPEARAVKGQLMGPVTVACSLVVEGEPFLDREPLRAAVADYVVRLARWQSDVLLGLSPAVVLVLDEAYLGVALRQRPERRGLVAEMLRSVVLRVRRPGVIVGVHCCDEFPFSLLNEFTPDLLSFDAYHGGERFGADQEAGRFLALGGHVAWGWVPTLDDLGGVDARAVACCWWEAATRLCASTPGMSVGRILARSLVTASCGLAGTSVATCERSFALARAISEEFARRAGAS
jgi:hypothetical protein